ncbi:MAG: riboflavin synthase [Proteobacteria bacterium]|nr:riboflavin synthase [Pseudomonadota bacterium]
MFTGIIQALGRLEKIDIDALGCRLNVNIQALSDQEIKLGDSIAVNGVCLTVVNYDQGQALFDVSLESLSKTCIEDWKVGDEVNLETALTLQTPLGGHIVTGHVDGIGVTLEREDAGDAIKMLFQVPAELGRYIAQKGSVCIDGVSLTTNQLLEDSQQGTTFAVMLVPHTLSVTSLKRLEAGSRVHIEIDVIARYLDRMQSYDSKNI